MIADEMEEGLVAGEITGTEQGLPVTARLKLLHKVKLAGHIAGRLGVGLAIAGDDHQADLFNARADGLLDDDPQGRFARAVPIHERLQRQGSLVAAGGGDHGFFDAHCHKRVVRHQVKRRTGCWPELTFS